MDEQQFGGNMKPSGFAQNPVAPVTPPASLPQNPAPAPKPFKRPAVLAVILLVVAAVILIVVLHVRNSANNGKLTISKTLPKGYSFTPTASGHFPADFPRQLIMGKNIVPFRGEDTVTATGENQKIIEYYSTSSPDTVYNLYKAGLPLIGWKVNMEIDSQTAKIISFKQTSPNNFEVLVTAHNAGSQVKLTYTIPKVVAVKTQ
jgi:hypothetical protein